MADLKESDLREDNLRGDGAPEDLPFPDKDISPALQRLLKRKFEEAEASGKIDAVEKDEFFRLLGKVAEESDPES